MGDGHDRARVLLEVPLQPGDRFGIEVIGWLVEQQQVRPLEENLAEGDATALAAGKGGGHGIGRRQPHGVHGDFNVAVELPGVGRVDGVLGLAQILEHLLHFVRLERLAQFGAQFLVAHEQGARFSDGFLDVATDVLGFVEPRLLRHKTDADAVGRADATDEILVLQRHHAQERALARAVGADDADLGPRVERQPDVLEHLALAVGLGEVLDGEDVLFRHGPWGLLGSRGSIRPSNVHCSERYRKNRYLWIEAAIRYGR